MGAYAAALALPAMTQEAATAAAVAHGLCSHLTSLIVVDEAGEAKAGVPNHRKVALSRPMESFGAAGPGASKGSGIFRSSFSAAPRPMLSASSGSGMAMRAFDAGGDGRRGLFESDPGDGFGGRSRTTRGLVPRRPAAGVGGRPSKRLAPKVPAESPAASAPRPAGLAVVAMVLDWDGDAARLSKGDVTHLSAVSIAAILEAARTAEVAAVAASGGLDAKSVVLGLLAEAASKVSRGAVRVARKLLAGADPALVRAASAALGL